MVRKLWLSVRIPLIGIVNDITITVIVVVVIAVVTVVHPASWGS